MATNLDPEELQLIRQTDIPYNFREAIQGGMFGIPGPVMFRFGHYYDPSVGDNWAIKYASQTGNLRVVNELLADRCVDPFAGDNYAIRKAIKYGHLDVVDAILWWATVRDNPTNSFVRKPQSDYLNSKQTSSFYRHQTKPVNRTSTVKNTLPTRKGGSRKSRATRRRR